MALPAEKERYTFADVLTWGEDDRIEIINGEAVMMAPPSRIHQKVSVAITSQLYNFLDGKSARSTRPLSTFACLKKTETRRKMLTRW